MTTTLPDQPASVQTVMQTVLIALVPGTLIFIYQTGWGGLFNITIAVLASVLFEALILWIRKKPIVNTLADYSAVVTGLLLALCLPPLIPWWMPMLGCAFAIVFAKHLYGGLGHNIFNPAMAGYAFLLVSFPRDLSLWLLIPDAFKLPWSQVLEISTSGGLAQWQQWDALTGATALDSARIMLGQPEAVQLTDSSAALSNSAWINLGFLAGGIWLWHKRVIGWHIPGAFIFTLLTLSIIHHILYGNATLEPQLHILGGATMLCAFFIATDPVSAATGTHGRVIYAAGIGLIVWIIRSFGGYPDGVAFAVLLMNCAVPTIDYLEPRLRRGRSA